MKTRKHTYKKQDHGMYTLYGLNGQPIATGISTEKVAQELAEGRDMLLAKKREAKR